MTELASWRDGPSRRALTDFVPGVTGADGSKPVPVEERIAVFDNDGTLWPEKPMPIQLDFILRRLVAMATEDAALRDRQPWKAAYTKDYGWLAGVVDRHYAGDDTDVPVLAARRPRRVRGHERRGVRGALRRLPARGRATRRSDAATSRRPIDRWSSCSGISPTTGSPATSPRAVGATSCARSPQEMYGIPRERVVGSSPKFVYTPDDDGGTLSHAAAPDYLDDGPEKPIRIWSRVGRRPLLAGGNSNGDIPMLQFARHRDKPSLRLLVLHDDPEREFDYVKGAEQALDLARAQGWTRRQRQGRLGGGVRARLTTNATIMPATQMPGTPTRAKVSSATRQSSASGHRVDVSKKHACCAS